MEIVSGLVEQHIENNANQVLRQSDFDAKYNALAIRYQEAKNKYDELSSKIAEKKNKGLLLKGFLNKLKEQKALLQNGMIAYGTLCLKRQRYIGTEE